MENTQWAQAADAAQARERVQSIKETVTESPLGEKVESLHKAIDTLSGEVRGWPPEWRGTPLEALNDIQRQVKGVKEEWQTLSASMKSQVERVDSLLLSFPGIIEISTLRALSLRISQLEQLVSEHIEAERAKVNGERSRKQLIISVTALGITMILWLVFILLQLVR